ncbi:MAG: YggS family pyridoxal phosphate-dependent enzyme, partial [Chloroflexota bacterium]
PDPRDVAAFAAAPAEVRDRIAAACARVGRDPSAVTLVAVSKTVPAERLRAAIAAGIVVLGENRVQEAEEKVPLLPPAEWHLVGRLQSNKVSRALTLFAHLGSVDSRALAERIDRLAPAAGRSRVPIWLQVNVDADPAKGGWEPDLLTRELPALLALPSVEVRGLMTVGRLVATADEARPTFTRLRALATDLRAAHPGLGPGLSMGMTDDYAVAVEEGSTLVRVGRAIFGTRPAP